MQNENSENSGKEAYGGRSAEEQAEAMKVTREQHAVETAEDYLEAISDLIGLCGEARVVDLANRLGIANATVIQTVKRLQRDGYVTSEPYRSIFLTAEGARIAEVARHRHQVTIAVLLKLGVSPEAARVDAEGMEHHVSEETLRVFEEFVGDVGKYPKV
ncbi:MAG: manganese-binding transcriptional regulator MntR [Akkermansiaceae bacterium]